MTKKERWDRNPETGEYWTKAEMDHMDWTSETYDLPPDFAVAHEPGNRER
jgi:hypothetical protein